jgi:hypothetical protein
MEFIKNAICYFTLYSYFEFNSTNSFILSPPNVVLTQLCKGLYRVSMK